jgi:large subunit ribosomal protein L35
MPKLKTRKSIAKRFKVTKTGKVLPYKSANTSHILSKKSKRRKRRLGRPNVITGSQAKTMRSLIRG